MPQVKRFKAKQALANLDCGHAINEGDTLVVTSVYTCEQEANWPLTILMACFHVLKQKQAAKQPAAAQTKQPVKK
jgi:hypothetical protein